MSENAEMLDGGKLALLPAYIVIDTSSSMDATADSGQKLIDVANEIVPAIIEVCERKPAVKDKLRLSLISFDSTAEVVIPLGCKDDFVPVPVLSAKGGTNYGAAFRLLRSEIEDGVRALNASGFQIFRPAVFFITDGEPIDKADDRDAAFADLIDPEFRAAPHIVMFGVADASPETLKAYVNRNGVAVAAKAGADAAEALGTIVTKLVSSIVQSIAGGEDHDAGPGFKFDTGDLDGDLLAVFD